MSWHWFISWSHRCIIGDFTPSLHPTTFYIWWQNVTTCFLSFTTLVLETARCFLLPISVLFLLLLLLLTCLCRLSLSSSESTQPTLPSPPHTRIRNVTNFWKRRRLRGEERQSVQRKMSWQKCSRDKLEAPSSKTKVSTKTQRRVPELRSSVHQVKHLRRVQELLELAEELHPLVVSTFGVDQDQQRTGARCRGGLPEAWKEMNRVLKSR